MTVEVPKVIDNLDQLFSGRWKGSYPSGAQYFGGEKKGGGDVFARKPNEWLTSFDYTRLNLYRQHSLMFMGDHYNAIRAARRMLSAVAPDDFFDEATYETLYIAVNILGLCSLKHADLIAGKLPEIRPDSRDNTAMQEAIWRITKNSKLHTQLYETALTGGYKGDAVFVAEFNARDRDEDNPKGKIRIKRVKPDYWFPEFDPEDTRHILSHTFAWTISARVNDKPLLKRIIHFDDRIERHLNVLDGNEICDEIDPEAMGLPPWEAVSVHDIGRPLVVHAPNFRSDEFPFGVSDYTPDVKSVADELNHRLTQFSNVLDKHGDPKMKGPDLIGPDGKVEIDDYIMYSLDEPEPGYIEHPSSALVSMSQACEKLIPIILFQMEMSPALVGWQEGAGVEKVEALRIKSINTISHKDRRQMYLDEALTEVFGLAMDLENLYGGFSYEHGEIETVWTDGLPESAREKAETMAVRLSGKPSVSQRGAVTNIEGDAADVEIERMEEEGVIGVQEGGELDLKTKPLREIFKDKLGEKPDEEEPEPEEEESPE